MRAWLLIAAFLCCPVRAELVYSSTSSIVPGEVTFWYPQKVVNGRAYYVVAANPAAICENQGFVYTTGYNMTTALVFPYEAIYLGSTGEVGATGKSYSILKSVSCSNNQPYWMPYLQITEPFPFPH